MSIADFDFWKIADALPGAILLVDLDGHLVEINRKARALLGVEGNVQGLALSSRLTGGEDRLQRYLRLCGGSRQPMPGRLAVKQKDGQTEHHAVSGARVDTDDSGSSGGLIALWSAESASTSAHARFATLNATIDQLTQEIRARRQAEALLEAEKHMLEMIVKGDPLEAALEELALSIEEHTTGMLVSFLLVDETKRLRSAAAPNLPARFIDAIDNVSLESWLDSYGIAHAGETVVVTDIATDPGWYDHRGLALKAGLQVCWSRPVRGSNGGILGAIVLYYRSTRAPTVGELRIAKDSALIAGIAIERYRTQENLSALLASEHEQRERAEAEIRAKDHFLAILSHELRNPLAAAANAAYALEALDESDRDRSELQAIIVNSTGMLKRILDDLLDISRLSAGKLSLQIAPFNLTSTMNELVGSFRRSFPHRELRFVCNDQELWVEGDQTRLQQTINNLLGNAQKYSNESDQIEIELSGDERELRLSVRDNGRGIDASILPTIFNPFTQADESLGRVESGLGLGLSLVRQFAEMHRGSVSAHSEGLGLGSEFVLRLPRICAPEKVQMESRVKVEVPCPIHVLVVEDNAGARTGLCRLLERWGHRVTPAADGEEALRLMRESPPDLALVDIGLPGISGYDVARTVSSVPGLANIRLIALTGYGQQKDRELTAEAGFDGHLVKPVNLSELKEIFGARPRD